MSDSRNLNNTCNVENCSNHCWKKVCKTCAFKMRMGSIPAEYGVTVNKPCTIVGCNEPTYTKKHVYCRNHYDANWRGIPPEDKRPKRKNGSPASDCVVGGCTRAAKSKGLCPPHYHESRYVPVERTVCLSEGCDKKPRGQRCKRHAYQFDRYGFTWEGKAPLEKIRQWREDQRDFCLVSSCEEKQSSDASVLCFKHGVDKHSKNCTMDFYVKLMAVSKCECCGVSSEKVRLVTDHDHSCPHPKGKMCQSCIRGRICDACNSALGHAKEDRERLRALVSYLDRTDFSSSPFPTNLTVP